MQESAVWHSLPIRMRDYHRSVPADCGNLSITSRSEQPFWRSDDRRFQNRCGRVYVLSGDPGYAGGEPVKGDPLRLCGFFNGGGSDPAGWHGNCFYCIRACDSLPDGLHQKHDFKVFGWYRIVPVSGVAVFLLYQTIECSLCEHSIVMNNRLQKLLCGGQSVETD